ncbi:MAG: hypothetical protein ABI629_04960, partial [bacterium]
SLSSYPFSLALVCGATGAAARAHKQRECQGANRTLAAVDQGVFVYRWVDDLQPSVQLEELFSTS